MPGGRPFHRLELIAAKDAAAMANVDASTLRRHAIKYHFGRKVGGRIRVSRVAFAMYLANDPEALWAYHTGDRSSPRVQPYFKIARCEALIENGAI